MQRRLLRFGDMLGIPEHGLKGGATARHDMIRGAI